MTRKPRQPEPGDKVEARQLSKDEWASKLGQDLDVAHPLEAVEGSIYGDVALFLRKPK